MKFLTILQYSVNMLVMEIFLVADVENKKIQLSFYKVSFVLIKRLVFLLLLSSFIDLFWIELDLFCCH